MVGGDTGVQPSNSARLAVGDMDGDKNPEVALYYTRAKAPETGSLARDNELRLLRLVDAGTTDAYSDTSQAPEFKWVVSEDSDVGRSYVQYDSVAVAMGDLDGDGMDELAALHGKTPNLGQPSNLYLDVYKWNVSKKSLDKPVKGEELGATSRMPSGKLSTPSLEASIADLDGDGYGELVWMGTKMLSSDQMLIAVQKWKVVAASSGAAQHVDLTGIGSSSGYVPVTALNKDYTRFSMTTGRFVYPDASRKLRKQIGIAHTVVDGGIGWSLWSWDAGTFSNLAFGNLSGEKRGNVVPAIVAADLDRDSMVLGQPTLVTVTDSYSPFFIVQSPPRHFDLLSEVKVPQKDKFGRDVKDKDGNVVMVPRMMDAFSEFEGYYSKATQGTEKAHMESTTQSTAGEWGASAGYEIRPIKWAYIPPPTFAIGLDYTGSHNTDETTMKGTTTTDETDAEAVTDDKVYYWVNDLDLWFYPVLYPVSQAWTTDANGGKTRSYIRYIVPRVSGKVSSAVDGQDVEWYQPWHNPVNLFSYPRHVRDTRDYPQGAANKPADSWWKDRNGTVFKLGSQPEFANDPTTWSFAITTTDKTQSLRSTQHTVAPYLNLLPEHTGHVIRKDFSFPIDLSGSYSWGTETTSSNDNSSLSSLFMNWPGAKNYTSRTGLSPDDQQFALENAVYTGDTGTFSLAYAVTDLKRKGSRIWGDGSPYQAQADPALNLPSYYVNKGAWSVNDNAFESGRLRGLTLTGQTVFSREQISGRALPVGSPVTGSLRVYNYSFVSTGKLTVSIKFQPITQDEDDQAPDATKATIDLCPPLTIDPIPGREQGASDNWFDKTFGFTPGKVGLGYIHVTILPPGPVTTDDQGSLKGGNLSVNNDTGYVMVGFYNPEAAGAVRSAPGPRSLKIVAGSMSVRPIGAGRALGDASTSLEPGQKALVKARIRYDDLRGAKTGGLLHVNVTLRDGKGIVGHRVVPLLLNGREHTVRMLYTVPREASSVPLRMLVSSPYLPAGADSKPLGRTAKTLLTIGEP